MGSPKHIGRVGALVVALGSEHLGKGEQPSTRGAVASDGAATDGSSLGRFVVDAAAPGAAARTTA